MTTVKVGDSVMVMPEHHRWLEDDFITHGYVGPRAWSGVVTRVYLNGGERLGEWLAYVVPDDPVLREIAREYRGHDDTHGGAAYFKLYVKYLTPAPSGLFSEPGLLDEAVTALPFL